jgi:hypothetical protein
MMNTASAVPHVASLSAGVRAELPMLRAPIALLVDDPMPCLNPLYYHRKFFDRHDPPHNSAGIPLVRMIAPDFLDRFCDVVQAGGARGKFSVVPNPFGLGELDRGFRGCSHQACERFIDTVRSRLSANFDITPEMITHGHALDLDTGRRLADNEDAWSRRQGVESLTRYLTHAAAILQRAGLEPNGFTSPWSFGHGVEQEYAQAALRAQKQVNGRSVTWYFLASSGKHRVMPRLTVLRRGRQEAVVHIVVGSSDYLWETQDTMRADEAYLRQRSDLFLTGQGQGRLADLAGSGSFVAMLTHWQSLYSNGTEAGLVILGRVLARIKRVLGPRVTWMRCSEMARYYAAARAARARAIGGGIAIRSPFACPGFTISIPARRPPAALTANGRPLRRIESLHRLRGDAWAWADGRTYACFDLKESSEVLWAPQRPRRRETARPRPGSA